jgi:hypothetical protein
MTTAVPRGDQTMKQQPIPKHLGSEGQSFWTGMIKEFAIGDTAGLSYLTRAAECLDRIAAAQVSIKTHGEVIFNSNGAALLNPACKLEKESRDGFLAAMRALRIDVEPPRPGPGRPPGTFNRAR